MTSNRHAKNASPVRLALEKKNYATMKAIQSVRLAGLVGIKIKATELNARFALLGTSALSLVC